MLYILNSLVGCVRNFQSNIVLLFKSLDLMDGRTIKKKYDMKIMIRLWHNVKLKNNALWWVHLEL